MTAFQQMDADLLLDPNISETITYWRNASNALAAIPKFTLQGSPNLGGEYASPTGPLVGSIFLNVADVPLGPQKGDLLTIPSMGVKTFFVQEMYSDLSVGWAEIKIRLFNSAP
jgi:hypothetical protein